METPGPADAVPTSRGLVSGERVFGRFTLMRQIGRGGMGVVWLVRDETLDAEVALKFLPDAVRWDAAALAALRRETRRSRELTHPHIVRVHDIHEDAGSAAIAMEYLAGGSLHQLRAARTPPVFTCTEISVWLPGLCAALDHAHAQGVVHRDLKPANLLVATDGAVKVTDFGIAQPLFETALRISQWAPSGTLAYMSPQQQFGEPVDQADDIYALGATLYELLTGKPPFYTGNLAAQIERRPPDSLAARRRQLGVESELVPAAWEEGIAACLAKRPEERPANAAALAARLTAPAAEAAVSSGPKPFRKFVIHYNTKGFGRFRRAWWVAAGILSVLGVWLAVWQQRPDPAADPAAARAVARSVAKPDHPSDATRAWAAWNLDGDGRDASGRGAHFRSGNVRPVPDRHGRIDRALHFNGGSDLLLSGPSAPRWGGGEPFTIALWVRPLGAGAGALASTQSGEQGAFNWTLFRNNDSLHLIAAATQDDRTVGLEVHEGLKPGRWTHLAVASDGRTLRLYADGRLAGETALPAHVRAAPAAAQPVLWLGSSHRLDADHYLGEMDDLRLWHRTLSAEEVARCADPAPPPRFAISRGLYGDTEDFAPILEREFGPGTATADWLDLQRWHADDAPAFLDEIGLRDSVVSLFLQRAGSRVADGKRRYFINRFDGVKPDYYRVHEELGGMTLALGSWFDARGHVLARLPWRQPETLPLASREGAPVEVPLDQAGALALTWRMEFRREQLPAPVSIRWRAAEDRQWETGFAARSDGTFALSLGASAGQPLARQVPANYDRLEFTATASPGRLTLRAYSVLGGTPVFAETLELADFDPARLVALSVQGVPAADLTVER